MSDAPSETGTPRKEDPETLVLRGKPPRVVRFRRGLIVGITGAAATALVALAWIALEPPSFRTAADESQEAEPFSKAAPEALANAPASYGDVPRLGPPLPGDLGRPILEHQRGIEASGLAPLPAPDDAAAAAGAERARRAAAEESARSAGVIVQLTGRGRADASAREGEAGAGGQGQISGVQAAPAAAQAERVDLLASGGSEGGAVNPHSLSAAPSPWILSAGTVIPASLITGLNSDLPGTVFAQVTENVRDSATGRTVLIPQGARLVGRYDSRIEYGQRRAMLVWQRIVFPDGSSVRLDDMPAADPAGFAGISDRVDFHSWRLLHGIVLSTLLGIGSELTFGSGERDLVRAIRESTQQNTARAGDQITQRNLDIRPTLKVRPGWPLRAVVHKDLMLRPWRG